MIKDKNLPLCYAPLVTMLIDDDKDYLEGLQDVFSNNQKRIFCSKAADAINLIKSNQYNYFSICEPKDPDATDHPKSEFNITKLHEHIYNPERLNNIGIVVVDYAMPVKNGLEVCKELGSLPVQKILLTGETDEKFAVRAFNDGLIDFFILKSEENLRQKIQESIQQKQLDYFCDISMPFYRMLDDSTTELLSNPDFKLIFSELLKDNTIVEYYMLDRSGSYLLLDAKNNPIWLAVKSEQEMQEYCDFISMYTVPKSVSDALKQRTKLPFFFTKKDFDTPPEQWEKYLHLVQSVGTSNKYYYAVIKGDKLYKLDKREK